MSCSLCAKATERSKAATGCQVSLLFPPWLPQSQPTVVVPGTMLSCVPLIPLLSRAGAGAPAHFTGTNKLQLKVKFRGEKNLDLRYNGTLAACWSVCVRISSVTLYGIGIQAL